MTAKKKIKINSDANETEPTPKEQEEAAKSDEEVSAEKDSKKRSKTEAAEPEEDLETKLKTAVEEAKQSYDRFLRVSAEFENYKKRSAREMEDFRKFANQNLLRDLLSIVDNLELAIRSSNNYENADNSLRDGIDLTLKEILKVFENHHVKPVEALGKTFDPKYHEAVMQEESDKHPENTITNELQKGYLIHDRLLRPSMVVVAAPPKKDSDGNTDGNASE
ncbi:MAG: nucleotide exchange factor GrpE [Desulfobacterales bacterium]|jgi:molecular chaperone GrpE